jgi:molybdopterin synthase catalytic subunit
MIRVAVSPDPIDVAAEMARVENGVGAVATFTGLVRADDGVAVLEEEAAARWSLTATAIVHRVGPMRPGERIVFVGTAAPHRAGALEACAFLIDRLKTDAPFWKREVRGGEARWVEARGGDEAAAARWRN